MRMNYKYIIRYGFGFGFGKAGNGYCVPTNSN